jgi:hypothetical protein
MRTLWRTSSGALWREQCLPPARWTKPSASGTPGVALPGMHTHTCNLEPFLWLKPTMSPFEVGSKGLCSFSITQLLRPPQAAAWPCTIWHVCDFQNKIAMRRCLPLQLQAGGYPLTVTGLSACSADMQLPWAHEQFQQAGQESYQILINW